MEETKERDVYRLAVAFARDRRSQLQRLALDVDDFTQEVAIAVIPKLPVVRHLSSYVWQTCRSVLRSHHRARNAQRRQKDNFQSCSDTLLAATASAEVVDPVFMEVLSALEARDRTSLVNGEMDALQKIRIRQVVRAVSGH